MEDKKNEENKNEIIEENENKNEINEENEKKDENKEEPFIPEKEEANDLSALSFSSYDSLDIDKLDKMGQYTCDQCSEIPKIIDTQLKDRKIIIKCKTHGQKVLDIKEYLLNALNHNIKNWKCSKCVKIQRKVKENFIYCCDCNSVFCNECYLIHIDNEKHKYKIESDNYNTTCKFQIDHCDEKYSGYCYECHTHYCIKCANEHNLHSVIPLNNMDVTEEQIENIKKINKEYRSLISYYESLIRLNNLIIYSYTNYRENYYNSYNINRIINNYKRNQNIKPKNDLDNDIIDPGEKCANLYKYINDLYKVELKEEETESFELDNKYFNDLDLKVLTQLPLKNLHVLTLENNCIRSIECLKDADFPDLVILNLNNNAIEDIDPLEHVKFVEFQALLLRNNNIKKIDVFGRASFDLLREIDLRNNKIDDIEVFEKHRLKFLQCLYLTFNDFNVKDKRFEKAVERLKNELIEYEFVPEDAKEIEAKDENK